MAVNKVVLKNGQTLIDLTGDTITVGDAVVGVTLHLASGEVVTGTLNDFTGATESANGTHGLVPQPNITDRYGVLLGDGDWHSLALETETQIDSNATTRRIFRLKETGNGTLLASASYTFKAILWENDDTTVNFGAQTVTLSDDVANYDFLLFEYMYSTSSGAVMSQLVSADATSIALRIVQAGINRTGGRNCTISGTSVDFDSASFSGATNHAYCVPYRITGIKL